MLKPIILSAPFHRAYNEHSQLASKHKSTFQPGMADQAPEERGELMIIHYREEEAIYVQAANDRVTIVISTLFTDETDRVFGKVFLQVSGRVITAGSSSITHCLLFGGGYQEFVDARRRSSAIGTAPQVMYTTRDPPLEVRNAPGIAGVKRSEDVGWITFGMPDQKTTSEFTNEHG
jgi:actin related protein 2/3 complex subunit 2